MVYYPLQLLQRLGVREVLLVTGQQHAGQFIDLLGDGKVEERGGGELLFDARPDLQGADRARRDRAGGRHGARLRRGRPARGLPRRQHLRARPARGGRGLGRAARSCSSRTCPTRRTSASSPTTATARSPTSSRRPASSTRATRARPPTTRSSGLYCYPPEVFEIVDDARALEPRRARDHRRQPRVRPARRAAGPARRGLVARRRQALAGPRRGRPPDRADGREQVIEGVEVFPLERFEDERGWFVELMRASKLPQPVRQSNLSFSRKGVIRGLHYHERGPERPVRLPAGHGAGRRARPRERRDVHRRHRRREPGRGLHPRPPRARLRGADRLPLPLPRHRGVRRGRPRRARRALERPARRRPLEHAIADPVGAGRGT